MKMSADFLDKDVVFINSGDRTSGSSSNFNISFSSQLPNNKTYDAVSLLNFSCPKSYYLINRSNDTFIVNENGTLRTKTLTRGNYSFTTMKNALTTLLASGMSYTYTVSTSTITGKYTFTVSGNNSIQPIFDFSGSNLYLILGFEQESYQFSSNTLSSINVVNSQLTNTIKLCCNFVPNSLLRVIIPNNSDLSIIDYNEQNPAFCSVNINSPNVSSTNFYLLDQYNNELDLNGLDFNFTLAFYSKNRYYEHMIEDKKMEIYIKQLETQIRDLSNIPEPPKLTRQPDTDNADAGNLYV